MKTLALAVLATAWLGSQNAAPKDTLRLAGSIELDGVSGRIDHLAADVDGRRLYVAALGNDTVEVADVGAMKVVKSITGFHEPQGIRFLPNVKRTVIANGGDGVTTYLDSQTFAVATTAKLSGDADNVRYDAGAQRVYVGYGNGALAVLDTDGKQVGNIPLASHPESFQLEASGPRIFVNVPSAGHVAVVDRERRTVTGTWPVTAARANYPMALDETHHRLFLGCRSPAKLLVYDTDSGRMITSVDIVGDTDDLFFDQSHSRLYVIGGGGSITVVGQRDPDHYDLIQQVPTASGARTGLFVPEWKRLVVAVPRRGTQRAEIRVFDAID